MFSYDPKRETFRLPIKVRVIVIGNIQRTDLSVSSNSAPQILIACINLDVEMVHSIAFGELNKIFNSSLSDRPV